MSENDPTPEELLSVASMLTGPGASDDEIAANFARASVLWLSAQNWLLSEGRERDEHAYVLNRARDVDNASPLLSWDDPKLHAISGYDVAHPKKTARERGALLWDCVDKAVERTFGDAEVKTLRTKFGEGIEESRFRELWPQLSKWRRKKDGTTKADTPGVLGQSAG